MRLFEIMSERVETIEAGDSAEQAWERMKSSGIHHLVVVRARSVVGVISDRDLGGPRGARLRRGSLVEDLMTGKVVTAKPDSTVREAANLLRGHIIGCLPVVDGKRLVGIVTITDLLELLGRGVERPIRAPKRSTMRSQGRGGRSAA